VSWRAANARLSAKRGVRHDGLVSPAALGECRAPFVEGRGHGHPIRVPHFGDRRRHFESAFRVHEQRVAGRRELALRGIEDVQRGDVVTRGAERAHRTIHRLHVGQQVGDEDDETWAPHQPGGL